MDLIFGIVVDIIFYFFCGALVGILFLVGINILILIFLAFGFRKQAKGLEDFLDKFAWPLRLGGSM
jgi:hypothetical protein